MKYRAIVIACLLFGACKCAPKPEPAPMPKATTTTSTDTAFDCPAALADTRTGGTKAGSYTEPTDAERAAFTNAIAAIADGKPADLAAIGFEQVDVPSWPDVVLVREKERRGGGAYVLRRASSSTLIVQAPHTFYDEGTLPIACDLFQRTRARALFINTVHRYKASPGEKHLADVAHNAGTLFQAATAGLVRAVPALTVVQTHGFVNREVTARAVVSSGEKRPGNPLVAKVAARFEAAIGSGRVLKYPEDTNELGATTNVQGPIVRQAGGRFIHVEMDDSLRRDLVADAALRKRALDALGSALSEP